MPSETSLPLAAHDAIDAALSHPVVRRERAESRRVPIVDDAALIVSVLSALLELSGYRAAPSTATPLCNAQR